MKRILFILLLNLPYIASSQVTLGQIDDFEDYTTRNWVKTTSIPNANIYDGGPLGTGDNFLRVTSSGSGSSLNLTTYNNAQWIGNYYNNNLTGRIKYITMDVRNSGSNILFVRMSFKYSSSSVTEIWSAINSVAVLSGEPWKRISFYIDPSAFVRVSGLNPFSTTFNQVTEARIVHNDAPSWDSDLIAGTLDIDNIQTLSVLSTEDFQINTIKVYPNPANTFVSVYSDNNLIQNFEYKIIDLTGKIIKNGNSVINEKINIESLTPGNYIIQIQSEDGQKINQKIIKS